MMKISQHKKAFTPLEKTTNFNLRERSSLTGFTILEVAIAAIIFSIAVAGIFSSISMIRRSQANGGKNQQVSGKKLQAAYCAKQLLESWRANVDQPTWDSGALRLTGNPKTLTNVCPGSGTYDVTYNVFSVSGASDSPRRVDLTISWTE